MNRRSLLGLLPALVIDRVPGSRRSDPELIALARRIAAAGAVYFDALDAMRSAAGLAEKVAIYEAAWGPYRDALDAMDDALEGRDADAAIVSGRLHVNRNRLSFSTDPEDGDGAPLDLGIDVRRIIGL